MRGQTRAIATPGRIPALGRAVSPVQRSVRSAPVVQAALIALYGRNLGARMQRIMTGLALGIVATVLLAGGAFAATGGAFVLGRNNAASSQTLLTNSNTTSPVLALSTRSGQVPLAV